MRITIIGNGGREHALQWKLAQHGHAVAMTHASMSHDGHDAELVIIGPEAPLAEGIVDRLVQQGVRAFGPTQAAARLEASKAFAKEFMTRYGIPTARFAIFDSYAPAERHLQRADYPVVIKASGLAGGKGVVVPRDVAEAHAALHAIMRERAFGSAGDQVVIEERLEGPEVSLMAFCDGETVVPMLPAQDHKRALDGDQGPNTGGMGAFCPSPLLTPGDIDDCASRILQPAVRGMAREGAPYQGVLYAGLMLTKDGPKVLEFNCRFGDPEAQVVLPMLKTDLAEIANACIDGRLGAQTVEWHAGACACIVLASGGYPGTYRTGLPIQGLDHVPDDILIFHAGTRQDEGGWITDGGRVLGVAARGSTLRDALARAYAGVSHIHFAGMHYRRDIGARWLDT
ncbi:MAG: phosphoribosylamine--glycine ligase [Anaerolineae bacterium]|nr:phosphoribosylamine--glycine ligase [Anaerolineae bacterium]